MAQRFNEIFPSIYVVFCTLAIDLFVYLQNKPYQDIELATLFKLKTHYPFIYCIQQLTKDFRAGRRSVSRPSTSSPGWLRVERLDPPPCSTRLAAAASSWGSIWSDGDTLASTGEGGGARAPTWTESTGGGESGSSGSSSVATSWDSSILM